MNKKSEINRITAKLAQLKKRNEKALVLFLTAGYPKIDSTVPLVLEFAQVGADIIELGMPFSDPLADGPVIQLSSQQAIKNGITLDRILSQVKEIRKHTDIPLLLMGYLTPILHYGEERFFANASKAGVDGIILPEVPIEEANRFLLLTRKYHLADILLVSPVTSDKRIKEIDKISSGFLYCVSSTGVTGRSGIGNIKSYVKRVKNNAKKNSVLVGFGIKTPSDAQRISQNADGVIVGSALIQKISQLGTATKIGNWVRQLKNAM
jgi:tryptophan synthase alpha chain